MLISSFHNQSLRSFTAGGAGQHRGTIKRGLGKESAKLGIFTSFGTESVRLGTFGGFGIELARLDPLSGVGTERARLGTFRGIGTERARLGTLNQNFEIFTKNENLPAESFFLEVFGRKSKNRPTCS